MVNGNPNFCHKFNRRPGPHPSHTQMYHQQQPQSSQAQSTGVTRMELDPTNYTAYVLLQLFDAYYAAWLKECNVAKCAANFNARLDHLNQSLESAFPCFGRFRTRIQSLARRNCFTIRRKLKITIEQVRTVSGNVKHTVTCQCLRVRIRAINLAAKGHSQNEVFYASSSPIQLQSQFSIFLDFPIELNDTHTKVYIQFLVSEFSPTDTDTSKSDLKTTNLAPIPTDHQQVLLMVKEQEISGFTGFSTTCDLFDPTVNEQVEFGVHLTWKLDQCSVIEHIKRPEVVAEHFSCALLAMGTYFWRFYGPLYTALFGQPECESHVIKSLNEVIFLLAADQKKALFAPLLQSMQKRVELYSKTLSPIPCQSDQCLEQFRLVHGVLLILELLSVKDQHQLLIMLRSTPFSHVLRLQCTVSNQQLQLHSLWFRRLALLVKKTKYSNSSEIEPYLTVVIETLIDTVKQNDFFINAGLTCEEIKKLQDDTINLFVKFYRKKTELEATENEEIAKEGEEEKKEAELEKPNLQAEPLDQQLGDNVESTTEEYTSVDESSENRCSTTSDTTDGDCLVNNAATELDHDDHDSGEVGRTVKADHTSAVPCHTSDTGVSVSVLPYTYGVEDHTETLTDHFGPLDEYTVPRATLQTLWQESMLEPEYYQRTVHLLDKIARKIDAQRHRKRATPAVQ